MCSLERMINLLEQTHLYDLSEKSATRAEFEQYAAYFDDVEIQLDCLLDNCFVETTNFAGNINYTLLYFLPDLIDSDLLKSIVTKRLAITNKDFTIEGIKRCLASGGLDAQLKEDFSSNTVRVKILSDKGIFGSEKEKISFIKECMPCHVEVIIE